MVGPRGWCTPDDAAFAMALETAKGRLETAKVLGIERIVASPPREKVDLDMATDRYSKLLEVSLGIGVPASVQKLTFPGFQYSAAFSSNASLDG